MFSELNKRLIEKEFSSRGIKNYRSIVLKPNDVEDLFKRYNCIEYLFCFYDGSDPQCNTCEKEMKCKDCNVYQDWWLGDKKEERLSFCNWIDVHGPGIWGQTQEQVNQYAKEELNDNIVGIEDRLFLVDNDKQITLFFYGRDTDNDLDYWFTFEEKINGGNG